MEWKGQAKGITVLDDYAHHPTEIRATIQALETVSEPPDCVFQPHLYSRTLNFLHEFGGIHGDRSPYSGGYLSSP